MSLVLKGKVHLFRPVPGFNGGNYKSFAKCGMCYTYKTKCESICSSQIAERLCVSASVSRSQITSYMCVDWRGKGVFGNHTLVDGARYGISASTPSMGGKNDKLSETTQLQFPNTGALPANARGWWAREQTTQHLSLKNCIAASCTRRRRVEHLFTVSSDAKHAPSKLRTRKQER